MKKTIILFGFVLLCFLNACSFSSKVQVDENKREVISPIEIIELDNCGGALKKEQTLLRSFTINIVGFENDEDIKNLITAAYSQYQNSDKTKRIIALPNTKLITGHFYAPRE